MQLTHLNKHNNPTMVDVSPKEISQREAYASGIISMSKEAFEAAINDRGKKGPITQTAIIAAIMGSKKTSELIPMCHPLMLSKVNVDISPDSSSYSIKLGVLVKCEGKTGVEMEAITGVSIGLLTIYDMLKAIDKSMSISEIKLESKRGGKSGDFHRQN
ncbi:molybdenum cofactor biosynthesis protein MoaC [Helicobacter cinaedi PAGU611]|uniref:cyclic pyranopterin monophosphate synthase MoaC n=1 Tax=Helicobacter cinaedi TaxID=213 RepID=UPI00025D368A|nr:cyclic pyranopterin monophosphate synthase MoaC [Helicobacter cinaedi]BAM12083.1 molybdenum cofactor biosynthesis protein MoaC [Helicobacter cinaedi PAGU611]BBB19708.1 molybdenum cofactor biosynthesis protein MoaC [Helicobacter cinaedi]